jgi:hypothetical protein
VPTDLKAAPATGLRHEPFCLPQPGTDGPRIERYPYMTDDPATGRSVPTHDVQRCLECGAATYTRRF